MTRTQSLTTPYGLRPEWADVTPVDPDEGLPEVLQAFLFAQYEPPMTHNDLTL